MDDAFKDFKEWMIVIFNNLLVLATDFRDSCEKLVKIIDRCNERHVILRMEESWIGVRLPTLFGYEVFGGEYRLSKRGRQSIAVIPMPISIRKVCRGSLEPLSTSRSIPDYSDLTADLNDTVYQIFSWDESMWKKNY